ncbi:unnamed protein product [Brassica rapa subsp. narinosa]
MRFSRTLLKYFCFELLYEKDWLIHIHFASVHFLLRRDSLTTIV